MKALACVGLMAALLVAGCAAAGGQEKEAAVAKGVRVRESFNDGWLFKRGEPEGVSEKLAYEKIKPWVMASGAEFVKDGKMAARPQGEPAERVGYVATGFDDSSWRRLDLPHDWAIEGPFKQELEGSTGKREYWGPAWYRKHFTLPASDAGRRICVDFDGAMSYATVWVNGRFAGGWPYGYASFRVDVTDYVKPGAENVIAVRLDSPKESSRWYPGAGIYRNVWLVKTAPVHVGQWGTYVTTPEVSKNSAVVNLRAEVKNESNAPAEATVRTRVFEAKNGRRTGSAVADWGTPTLRVDAGKVGVVEAKMTVARPRIWDLKSPNLYVAVTTVEQGGKVVDAYETPFGIRTIRWDADKGFLLNGERVAIQGVCDHHDLGPLGAAFNVRAAQRQIEILQEMGCNAIRTSHNPPAPELLELCDRMGMLVMDESFDCWAAQKRPGDYHLLFPDWHERDWRAELRRDRNHPSIIIWSIGNEVREQGDPGKGFAISESLTRIAHEEDPTRPTSVAANNPRAATNGFAKTIDIYGFNYKPDMYPRFHQEHPNQPVYGSETASCVSSRGEYFFPVEENKDKGKANFQVSSYDLYAPRWAWPPDVEFKGLDQAAPYAAGEFVWTGFDYLGEPTPFGGDASNLLNMTDPKEQARIAAELKQYGKIAVPSRSSYFGIVDLCGFKKDRFYIYQARWRPALPMVHILPHWNWPDRVGQVTPVHVYTSGDEAELFVNGKSMGRKTKGKLEYRIRWDDVKYEPGEVRAVAYKNGKKWAEETVQTTGEPAKLKVEADRKKIAADGSDLSFVTVSVVDAKGRVVPRSKNMLKFSVEGAGELVAVDNGDPTEHRAFQSAEYPAFNGLCLAIVKANKGGGTIRVRVSGEGTDGGEVTVTAR